MSSKQWDKYGDSWEEKWDPPRDLRRDFSQKYCRDGHDHRRKEHRKEPSGSRDWNRSPVRRRASSPDREALDKKRFVEEESYRLRRNPVGGRQSLDAYRDTESRYRRRSPDPRHSYCHHDGKGSDPAYRQHSDGHRGGERSRDYSENHSVKRPGKPTERSNSLSEDTFREDRTKDYPKYRQNGSDLQSFPSDVSLEHAAIPQQTSSKGFERFLDILNKGVNVNLLTRIVTQSPTEADHHLSPVISVTHRSWSPSQAEPETQELHRPDSPQLSLKGVLHSDVEPPPKTDSRLRSKSPPVPDTPVLTPEEEHKRRQMQDVLQAIGVDLGLEELGQMSHRIQERLYGRRDSRKPSREGSTRRERSPSQSSSPGRSTFTPLSRDGFEKQRSDSNQSEETEQNQDQHRTVKSDPDADHQLSNSGPGTSGSSSHSEVSKSIPVPSNFPSPHLLLPTPPSFHWSPAPGTQWSSAPDTQWIAPPPFPQWSPAAVSKPPSSSVTPPYSPIPFPPPPLPNASQQFFPPPPLPPSPFPQNQPSPALSAGTSYFQQVQPKPKAQPRYRYLQVVEINNKRDLL